jgi:hypothetical protein
MEIHSESKTHRAWYWAKVALFHVILASTLYYFLFDELTTKVFIGGMLDRPFSAEKTIAGIGALAIVWWNLQPKITGREDHGPYAFLKRHSGLVYLLFLFPFVYVLIFFPSYKVPLLHANKNFDAVNTILADSGYCGENKSPVPHSDCAKEINNMIDSESIAGGFEKTVYAVNDPTVQNQIKQAYATAFLTMPRVKHLIVYFDPNPPSRAQSKAKDAFIEMRK